ncbi:MAG TPA: YbaK/EbsC family protein [Chloroflexota bacterium]|nr:YbaK/EbsC family protein [Chloroflexota bacterium]
MMVYDQILRLLDEQGVAYTLHHHEPVRTVAEVEERLPLLLDRMLKTIAFRLRDGRYLLAGLRGHDRLSYPLLARALAVNRRDITSLSPEEVAAELGFEVGGVGPFALREDVVVLFDGRLAHMGLVYCGSGRSTVTLAVDFADLRRVTDGRVVALVG